MSILYWSIVPLITTATPAALAQSDPPKPTALLTVTRTNTALQVDGVLDEEAWAQAGTASPFINSWPTDSGYAEAKTDVKLLFDNDFIYVAAMNHQPKADIVIQTLKRDQKEPFWNSDGFSIVIDPLQQKTAGVLFGVNAGGAQIEGALSQLTAWASMNENWDNKWFSAVKVYDTYWVAEMAIPFTALRFKGDAMAWGLNFIRNDMKHNAYSTWSPVPRQLTAYDLAHLGVLQWAEPITPHRSRITLIPYASGAHSRNHEDLDDAQTRANAGLDAKVSITSSLNLDLTLRPDFSNVDVDRQMTNMTRYSLLFPERRNFFLENADLFSNFGSWNVKPFFSRKIGIYDGEAIPIVAGARLSGNITNGLRVGIMDVQTEMTEDFSANNYLVASVQQRLLARSSVRFLTTNRQTTRTIEGDTEQDYNRTYGGEFQYVSAKGNLNAWIRAHTSVTPQRLDENNYLSTQLSYNSKKMYGGLMLEQIGENYVNDVAFIPRLYNYDVVRDTTVRIGHYTVNPWLGWFFYAKKESKLNMVEANTYSVINYRASGDFLERFTSVSLWFAFKDTRKLVVEVNNSEVNLPFATDILDNDKPIPVAHYMYTQYSAKYTTDSRKALNAEASVSYGNFYNGTRAEYGITLNARKQPWGSFGISYLLNDIRLPEEYGQGQFTLICPRAEISLRNNMWWTTFLQYNTQAENFNLNSRFQWRFKPMSDFFVVYTDNYATTDMKVKNRGVVLK